MEILTIVLANIRHKKGAFIGIFLLMLIISVSVVSIISINDNNNESLQKAHEYAGTGDITLAISESQYTDELRDKVKNHEYVQKVVEYTALFGQDMKLGEQKFSKPLYMIKLHENVRLYNEECDGFMDDTSSLKTGEMYISQGIVTNLKCKVGDKVTIETVAGIKEFVIKGIIEEPLFGCSNIGTKIVFISDEDHELLKEKYEAVATEEDSDVCKLLSIFQKDDIDIPFNEFRRQLNLDTGIEDNANGSISKEDSVFYTNIYSNLITSALIVFMCVLVVIVLIVMCHSITTSIEMDYTNLGILKSQGFSNSKLRIVLMLQYVIAEIAGIIAGIVLAVPIVKAMGDVFQPISGILSENNISVSKSMLIIGVIIVLSIIIVYWTTRRIVRISPVNAITGGKDDVYFDSRLNAPISKNGLMVSIAFRQFTSDKRKYIGAISIVAILVLFMMTVSTLSTSFNSKSALESMGENVYECAVYPEDGIDEATIKDIESIVEKYSEIEKKYYINGRYVGLNGETYYCTMYKYPEVIMTLEGRAPLYDNEIVITPILSEKLGLKIGDKVILSNEDNKAEYIISGIFQSMNDVGKTFAMSLEGARKIGIDRIYMYGFSLKNPENKNLIVDEINIKYKDVLTAESYDIDKVTGIHETAVILVQLVIYILSIVFAVVVVAMVCSKLFLKERKDIGIYRALGFTTRALRLQFAIRFLIIALIGSVFGCILSLLFTETILGALLKIIGMCVFKVTMTVYTIAIPIVAICVSFFVFAYISSRKVKTVETRELVIE